ncbi:MAG: pyridoxamine 5'-phosphate oxidase family protein [Promethearchaeota archaeon]
MKIVKLPRMDNREIKETINSQKLCRIAFIDDKYPYIAPFQYVCINDELYFHFTNYGKKKKILSKNTNVCVSIENFEPDLSRYYFISMQGNLEVVENIDLKAKVIYQMKNSAGSNYSENFLSVHGFDKKLGWEGFVTEDQLIYKFIQSKDTIGLKSI